MQAGNRIVHFHFCGFYTTHIPSRTTTGQERDGSLITQKVEHFGPVDAQPAPSRQTFRVEGGVHGVHVRQPEKPEAPREIPRLQPLVETSAELQLPQPRGPRDAVHAAPERHPKLEPFQVGRASPVG